MKWGTVSFIFYIVFDEVEDIEKQQEHFIEEEYYLFEFTEGDKLTGKIKEKISELEKFNNQPIIYNNKSAKRKLLGTRKFCWATLFFDDNDQLEDGSVLANSLFYTDTLEKAKKLAKGHAVNVQYYNYGKLCLINAQEE